MESQSSSSSSSTFTNNTNVKQPPFRSPLNSVRKVPAKPWKKHVASLPPTPPGIYTVEPKDFKDLVQKLTKGPPDFQPRRLQSLAPPPLSRLSTTTAGCEKPATTTQDLLPSPITNTTSFGASVLSPLGFSPSSAWSSFLLMSPGTTASLEQSTTL